MVSFWLPVLLFISTFGFNHGTQGNVDTHNRIFTNATTATTTTTTKYPYTDEQSQDHTSSVLLECNVTGKSNDAESNDHSSVDTENDQSHGTSPVESVVSTVLGYSELVCEKEFQDCYTEQKQVEVETETDNANLSDPNLEEPTILSEVLNRTHKLEPDGTSYNYASASKGAKVVGHNKEANGASNILGSDHDKYLINQCSVVDKYVIIELAEETLVDAVNIANFEHHSSNFKQFSLSGSLVFPTEIWVPLGTFVAENVKHRQYFKLPKSQWARYLNLSLVSHYGSEFYCTLNVFEVYGTDAIETMLVELTNVNSTEPPDSTKTTSSKNLQPDGEVGNVGEADVKKKEGGDDGKGGGDVAKKSGSGTKIPELVSTGNGRIHSDAVLKILMQKIRSLEKNLSLLESYIKDLNKKQGDVFPQLDVEVGKYSELVENTRSQIKDLLQWNATMEKEIADLESWKHIVSSHMESVIKENTMLRLAIEKIASDQENLDKAELTVLTVSVSFAIGAILKIVSDRIFKSPYSKPLRNETSWKLLLVTCVVTAIVVLIFF